MDSPPTLVAAEPDANTSIISIIIVEIVECCCLVLLLGTPARRSLGTSSGRKGQRWQWLLYTESTTRQSRSSDIVFRFDPRFQPRYQRAMYSPPTALSSSCSCHQSLTWMVLPPCPILLQCSPEDTNVSSYQVSYFNIIPLHTSNESKTFNTQECWRHVDCLPIKLLCLGMYAWDGRRYWFICK